MATLPARARTLAASSEPFARLALLLVATCAGRSRCLPPLLDRGDLVRMYGLMGANPDAGDVLDIELDGWAVGTFAMAITWRGIGRLVASIPLAAGAS